MDRGAWWATVHGVPKKSDVTERLFHFHFTSLSLGSPREQGADFSLEMMA